MCMCPGVSLTCCGRTVNGTSVEVSGIQFHNSILIGLPSCSTAPLQRLQNAAARLVMGLRARDHVTSALASLHWLPVHFRIMYKVALTMFYIHTNQCPAYLNNIVIPLHGNPSRQRLRSSAGTDYLIPPTRTKLGEWSLVVGPTTWNFQPETVCAVTDTTAFKHVLKTNFFNIAFISSN